MSNKYDDVDRTIDDLLAERRPRALEVTSPEELEILKAAAVFKAARPGAAQPEAAFVSQLADRLVREQRQEQTPSPNRRRLILGGLAGAAASLLAGVGLDRLLGGRTAPVLPPRPDPELVGNVGRWFPVAHKQEVAPGTVLRVRAGAIEGFIMYREEELVAMSAMCSHMGCALSWRREDDDLFCPCHGARFYTNGTFKQGRVPYKPLAPLRVKLEGDTVYLWAVDEVPPSGTT